MKVVDVIASRTGVRHTLPRELFSVLKLIRFDKPLASAIFALIGVYLAGGWEEVLSTGAMLAALSMSLIVASSFAFNDVQDAVTDGNGKPNRPIPSGRITRRYAFIVASALAVAGVAIASTLGVLLAVFSVVLVALSVAYSFKLKGTPLFGNALVGLMIASILPYGALVTGHVTEAVVEGFILTFLFAFSTEILYTIRDENADRIAGIGTVAVKLGRKRAFRIFEAVAISLTGLGFLFWALGLTSNAYLIAAMLCSIVPIVSIVVFTSSGSEQSIQTATFLMRRISLLTFIPIFLLR